MTSIGTPATVSTRTPADHHTARLIRQAHLVRLFRTVYRIHAAYLITVFTAVAVTLGVAFASQTDALIGAATGLCAAWLAGFATLSAAVAADLHLNQ